MLTAHLWKEWRQQRALVLVFAGVLLVAAIAVGTLPSQPQQILHVEVWFVIFAVGFGLVALAGDLVPGEARRGQLAQLRRLPRAPGVAFGAKMIVLFGGLLLLWALGATCGSLAAWLYREPMPSAAFGGLAFMKASIVAGAVAVAPWAFAVSCWMPRGATVLPATALLVGAIVVPPILVLHGFDGLPGTTGSIVGGAAFLLIGIAVARVSFLCGTGTRPRGRGALCAGLLAAVAPIGAWAWTGLEAWDWYHVDPRDPRVGISRAMIGSDGRFAFVNLTRERRPRRGRTAFAVRIDLDSGTWQQVGDPQAGFFGPGIVRRSEWLSGISAPHDVVVRWQATPDGKARVDVTEYFDARTGELIASSPGLAPPADLVGRIDRSVRRTTNLRMPDGRSVWFDGDRLLAAAADGAPEPLPWTHGDRPGLVFGFGFQLARDSPPKQHRYYDLGRGRVIEFGRPFPFVRPGAWLVSKKHRPGTVGFELCDPDSGSHREARGFRPGESLGPMLADGTFLVWERDTPNLAVVDPETGARRAMALDEGPFPIRAIRNARQEAFRAPLLAPRGTDVLVVTVPSGERFIARFDGRRLTRSLVALDRCELAARAGEDAVIVVRDQRTIERLHFGSARREVLFPVPG